MTISVSSDSIQEIQMYLQSNISTNSFMNHLFGKTWKKKDENCEIIKLKQILWTKKKEKKNGNFKREWY